MLSDKSIEELFKKHFGNIGLEDDKLKLVAEGVMGIVNDYKTMEQEMYEPNTEVVDYVGTLGLDDSMMGLASDKRLIPIFAKIMSSSMPVVETTQSLSVQEGLSKFSEYIRKAKTISKRDENEVIDGIKLLMSPETAAQFEEEVSYY